MRRSRGGGSRRLDGDVLAAITTASSDIAPPPFFLLSLTMHPRTPMLRYQQRSNSRYGTMMCLRRLAIRLPQYRDMVIR